MGRVYVAVDLETTGLNPERDAIIELGAVRFRDGEVLEEFSQVVNPGRPIPRGIQQLTGISQAEADRAPSLYTVASKFRTFIGDAPLVGHNVGFDVGFLRSNDLYRFNPTIDTWELAAILLPGLPSYKLVRLAEHLGVELVNAHRAFDDALASMHVFEGLRQRLLQALPEVVQQINQLAAGSEWALRDIFRDAEREMAQRLWKPQAGGSTSRRAETEWRFDRAEPLEPVSHPQPLDVDALAGLLGSNGPLADAFPGYELRPQQIEMLRAVASAFNASQHLMIEAGTGTGKSLAYLIPALTWAAQTGQRVVISTNTINLQEQLFHKDLPDLHHVLPFDFRVAVMKGRSNYLCPRRLKNVLQRRDLSPEEISVLARILIWLPTTQTGDQSEITLSGPRDYAIWERVASDGATCSPTRCREKGGSPCFFYEARRQAEAAHVIIVNHALLLADIAADGNVLPAYQYLIVDEAHHLEDATTRALSLTVDHAAIVTRLRELAPTSSQERAVGLLANMATTVQRSGCPEDRAAKFITPARELAERIPALDVRVGECFVALDWFLSKHSNGQNGDSDYDQRQRITDVERVQPGWADVEIAWDNLAIEFKRFLDQLERVHGAFNDLSNYTIPDFEEQLADLQRIMRDLDEAYRVLDAAILQPDANAIYWLRRSQRNGVLVLNSAPLSVGNLIERHVFLPKDTVILTSATLRTAGSFDYLRKRLGAHEADERELGSPFDYRSAALVYLPTDMPEPNQPDYQSAVEKAILQLGLATDGRLMALFTSYSQLQRTAESLRAAFAEAGFTLFVQGEGGSRQQLLDAFRQTQRAVLMGTRSFWEGVDVQGEALSALVITRLPFAVPTDPIVAARSQSFDSPFYEYNVPEAILHFRQGFGRLIRSASDRGVCVILDRRIVSKSYGRLFVEALPDCTVQRGSLSNLPEAARRWLRGDAPVSRDNGPALTQSGYTPAPPLPEWWE